MNQTTFQLETLSCPSCIRKIETALTKTDGVKSAAILFNSSKVKVEYDENLVKPEALQNVITSLGYTVLASR